MKIDKIAISIMSVRAAAWTPAHGYEAGAAGWAQKPGITLGGSSAEAPPPGLYMVDQVFTYQTNLTGPGNNVLNPQAQDEVSANAPGGTPQLFPGPTITKGVSAFAQLSYRLWAPDAPVSPPKFSRSAAMVKEASGARKNDVERDASSARARLRPASMSVSFRTAATRHRGARSIDPAC